MTRLRCAMIVDGVSRQVLAGVVALSVASSSLSLVGCSAAGGGDGFPNEQANGTTAGAARDGEPKVEGAGGAGTSADGLSGAEAQVGQNAGGASQTPSASVRMEKTPADKRKQVSDDLKTAMANPGVVMLSAPSTLRGVERWAVYQSHEGHVFTVQGLQNVQNRTLGAPAKAVVQYAFHLSRDTNGHPVFNGKSYAIAKDDPLLPHNITEETVLRAITTDFKTALDTHLFDQPQTGPRNTDTPFYFEPPGVHTQDLNGTACALSFATFLGEGLAYKLILTIIPGGWLISFLVGSVILIGPTIACALGVQAICGFAKAEVAVLLIPSHFAFDQLEKCVGLDWNSLTGLGGAAGAGGAAAGAAGMGGATAAGTGGVAGMGGTGP